MKNFVSGKKKLTMFLVAAATAAVNAFVADPSQAETITQLVAQYLPTLIVFAGSIFGVNRETKVDVEREKTRQLDLSLTKSKEAANGASVKQKVEELADEVAPIAEAYHDPFDAEEFAGVEERKLKNRAAQTYLQLSPITLFFAAQDKGKVTRCKHIDQALSYWDYLHTKGMDAFEHMYGFPHAEADEHLADDNDSCPYYSVENMARQKGIHYWNMLLNVRWVLKKQAELEKLAETDINWKSKLDRPTQTLFGLGQLASELIKNQT